MEWAGTCSPLLTLPSAGVVVVPSDGVRRANPATPVSGPRRADL